MQLVIILFQILIKDGITKMFELKQTFLILFSFFNPDYFILVKFDQYQ